MFTFHTKYGSDHLVTPGTDPYPCPRKTGSESDLKTIPNVSLSTFTELSLQGKYLNYS